MKYTIDVEPAVQKALEKIASFDSKANHIISPEDVIFLAISTLLRVRSLTYEDQILVAAIIEHDDETT